MCNYHWGIFWEDYDAYGEGFILLSLGIFLRLLLGIVFFFSIGNGKNHICWVTIS